MPNDNQTFMFGVFLLIFILVVTQGFKTGFLGSVQEVNQGECLFYNLKNNEAIPITILVNNVNSKVSSDFVTNQSFIVTGSSTLLIDTGVCLTEPLLTNSTVLITTCADKEECKDFEVMLS